MNDHDHRPRIGWNTDFLADVGDLVRVVSSWLFLVLAVLFILPLVLLPITATVLCLQGQAQIALVVFFCDLMMALFAAFFFWIGRRLVKNERSEAGMVLPLWFIQLMGAFSLMGAAPLAWQQCGRFGLHTGLFFLPGIGMLLAPWFIKRRNGSPQPPASLGDL